MKQLRITVCDIAIHEFVSYKQILLAYILLFDTYYFIMLKIGNITLSSPVIAAPLSGYSDTAMRMINRRFGCELTFGGLMLDKSTAYKKVLRKPEFTVIDGDHPVGGQICGTEPEVMAQAAKALVEFGYDIVDLNFACPAPKVVRRGRGGALLKDPSRVLEIIKAVRDVVSCPLSVKLRRGFDNSEESREKFWQICEGAVNIGLEALYIHGRTTMQLYKGEADWKIIEQVKQKYPDSIIIGSGDLMDAQTIKERLEQTGIDGVIAARGMIGNPWIFSDCRAVLNGEPLPAPPDLAEQYDVITEHFSRILEHSEEIGAVRYFRKFMAKYARRHPSRKKMMMELIFAKTREQMVAGLKKWYVDFSEDL